MDTDTGRPRCVADATGAPRCSCKAGWRGARCHIEAAAGLVDVSGGACPGEAPCHCIPPSAQEHLVDRPMLGCQTRSEAVMPMGLQVPVTVRLWECRRPNVWRLVFVQASEAGLLLSTLH